jgi:hypothetical protein
MFLATLLFDSHRYDPRAGRVRAASLLSAAFAILGATALLPSCTTAPFCEPLARCGGDLLAGAKDDQGTVTSEWVAEASGSCMDQVQLPVVPVSLSQQPAKANGRKGAAPATVDWCASLLQKPDGSLRYQPFFPIIPLQNAHLKIYTNGTYDAHFLAAAPQQMAFSAACRAAQGINFTCAELGRHVKAAIASESNVANMRCYDDGEDGCTCDYELSLFTSLPGSWGADSANGVVTFYDESGANAPPAPADYCLKGDTLEMTGHAGQRLFGRADLRTLVFRRPGCSDGLQDGDEDGIDCGGACGNVCSTCGDGAQNGNETGIDCGGSCPDYCACFNGARDPWEEGVDCGGPCSLTCACKNGAHDDNEGDGKHPEGVDCGGECQPRFSDKGASVCP